MHHYDDAVARHYQAYRPALHGMILERALGRQTFGVGLDIGCGTGQSSIALAAHCEAVIGTDNSSSMLSQALSHPSIEYRLSKGGELPVEQGSIEIVTLAGVLPYLNQRDLITRLVQAGTPDLCVVVYDFAVDSDQLKSMLALPIGPSNKAYDHSLSLAGLPGVETMVQTSEAVDLSVTAEEAAHLILASDSRYQVLSERYDGHDPFAQVAAQLGGHTLSAQYWVAAHRLVRDRI